MKIVTSFFSAIIITGTIYSQCQATFEEQDGLVVVEVESVSPAGDWSEETQYTGYTGDGYFEWKGSNQYNTPGIGTLTYEIQINNPGTYRFLWYSRIGPSGDPIDKHNDSWLRIEADSFYGSGGVTGDWFKVWNQSYTWSWGCKGEVHGHNGLDIWATFDNPGVYNVKISGRSNGHAIDRFILFDETKYNFTRATNLANSETRCGEARPEVIHFTPSNGATGIPDTTEIQVEFNMDIDILEPNISFEGSVSGVNYAKIEPGPNNHTVTITHIEPFKTETISISIPCGSITGLSTGRNNILIEWSFSTIQTIFKQDQTINCLSVGPYYTNQEYDVLSCTVESGLPIIYEKINGPFLLDGDTVKLLGVPGKCFISASQPGNKYWNPAEDVMLVVDVLVATDIQTGMQKKKARVWFYDNVLHIENAPGKEVEIYSLFGNLAHGVRIYSTTFEFDMQGMPNGIYLVKTGDRVFKVVK
jgi:hypothetical protein